MASPFAILGFNLPAAGLRARFAPYRARLFGGRQTEDNEMSTETPVEIGEDRQLFVDDFWIADLTGVERVLHSPTRQSVARPAGART